MGGAVAPVQVKVRARAFNRLEGMERLYWDARGASVFDVGCNRGVISFEMAFYGATKVHGCDIDAEGIELARQHFADIREVDARFEVVDLTKGPAALRVFAGAQYDITLLIATYHKLKRVMAPADLTRLIQALGGMTRKAFAWRGTSDKPAENDEEIVALDRDLGAIGLRRIHTSYTSQELGVSAIWGRG